LPSLLCFLALAAALLVAGPEGRASTQGAHLVIAEAIDTAYTIGWAIVAWIMAAAFVATVVLFTTMLAVAQGWKTARRALCGPSWARGRIRARIHARRLRRRHSGHTGAPDYQEAA
jgi:hypothetical protein